MPARKLFMNPRFSARLRDNLSYLMDAAIQGIPTDPVFACYTSSSHVRIMSASSLDGLKKPYDEARQCLITAERDHTGIALALATEQSSTLLRQYQTILQGMVEQGLNDLTLDTVCRLFDTLFLVALDAAQSEESRNVYMCLYNSLSEDCRRYFAQYFKAIEDSLQSASEERFPFLSVFFSLLQLEQVRLYQEAKKKLLDDRKHTLSPDEILCPYTRARINVSKSLVTGDMAGDFVDLMVAMALLADVTDDSVAEFLAAQPEDYSRRIHHKLCAYLCNPAEFSFTLQQTSMLEESGILYLQRQWHRRHNMPQDYPQYDHLWDKELGLKQNILRVLRDYSKLDCRVPAFSLFATGHWFRHHHGLVRSAVTALCNGDEPVEVIRDLEAKAMDTPDFNPEGSLSRRLVFISRFLPSAAENDQKPARPLSC
ncbi:DUF5617 domain-containing protein [Legionella spiritensis]|uniref:DUF5617 domain-containing protein n=1 Tax=Legionella spiritensis TaxID=452 RepID=UPI000F6BAA1D|nr:DUF5617 domain-containing protein [Legionella spiritensis]VEG92286.1 Uncharacterised protein [Legionella spiritensis]